MVAHPKLKLDISYNDRQVDILAERFDVAVRMGSLADSTLVARRIAPLHVAVLASPGYLEKQNGKQIPFIFFLINDKQGKGCYVFDAA